MKKLIFYALAIILLITCSSCNKKSYEINGYKSEQEKLNILYENRCETDLFITLVYSEKATSSNFFMEDYNSFNKKELFEVTVYFDNVPILNNDNTVNLSDLKEGDVVICYTHSLLESNPYQIYCEQLFYLGLKSKLL